MTVLFPAIVVGLALRWTWQRNLEVLRFQNWKRPSLIAAAVVVQLSAAITPAWARWPSTAASLALASIWLIVNDAHQNRYLRLFLVGLALNALVMVLNHGMPVSAWALEHAGYFQHDVTRGHFLRHLAVGPETRLRILADIVPLRFPRSVISLGDIVMLSGLIGFLVTAFRRSDTTTHTDRGVSEPSLDQVPA